MYKTKLLLVTSLLILSKRWSLLTSNNVKTLMSNEIRIACTALVAPFSHLFFIGQPLGLNEETEDNVGKTNSRISGYTYQSHKLVNTLLASNNLTTPANNSSIPCYKSTSQVYFTPLLSFRTCFLVQCTVPESYFIKLKLST